jgi:hypothetical protein
LFREIRPFEARSAGQTKPSEFDEEWLIRDFFADRRDGPFLDVGAHHHCLETALGWSGLAIEPQLQFAADYAINRPRTRFVAMFASDIDDRCITLLVPPDHPGVASSTSAFASQWRPRRLGKFWLFEPA